VNVTDYLKRADELAGQAEVAHYSPLVPEPGPLHLALVDLLENMLMMMEGFAQTSGKVPAPLRAMGRTLKTLKPMMLEELGAVPEEEVRRFLANVIVAPINQVLSTPEANGKSARSRKHKP
jgi:hypothetical protein